MELGVAAETETGQLGTVGKGHPQVSPTELILLRFYYLICTREWKGKQS
jgi:hypothetical protein